jgi:hypothetical protein
MYRYHFNTIGPSSDESTGRSVKIKKIARGKDFGL